MKKQLLFLLLMLFSLKMVYSQNTESVKPKIIIDTETMVMPNDLPKKYNYEQAKIGCADLTAFGYSDWRLPTQQENGWLQEDKEIIGGFKNEWYWCISKKYDENDKHYAYRHNFGGKTSGLCNRESLNSVRCVRTIKK